MSKLTPTIILPLSMASGKRDFCNKILVIAEEMGYILELSGDCGCWINPKSGSFGVKFTENINSDDFIYQICRCFNLTLNLGISEPINI